MNDRELRLLDLRRAHRAAIDHYDYASAKSIHEQALKVQAEDPEAEIRARTLRVQHENVLAQYDAEARILNEKTNSIILKYRERYNELGAQHDQQMEKLAAEYKMALSREEKRPIPEVDRLLLKSKVVGRDHQYSYAQEVFEEAILRRDEITRERMLACQRTFKEQRDQLLQRQANELLVLKTSLEAALEKVMSEHKFQNKVIDNRVRVKEFKAGGVWRREVVPFSNTSPKKKAGSPKKRKRLNPRLDPTASYS